MTAALRRWFTRRPYAAISLVFLAVAACGWRLFGWDARELLLLVVVFCLALLGVRLDDIHRAIGGGEAPGRTGSEAQSLLAELREIRALLERIERAHARPAAGDDPKPPPPA